MHRARSLLVAGILGTGGCLLSYSLDWDELREFDGTACSMGTP